MGSEFELKLTVRNTGAMARTVNVSLKANNIDYTGETLATVAEKKIADIVMNVGDGKDYYLEFKCSLFKLYDSLNDATLVKKNDRISIIFLVVSVISLYFLISVCREKNQSKKKEKKAFLLIQN